MLKVVVIQGPPAAGKTTLVHKLADELKVGYIAKDSIKELLYDTLGTPLSRDMSRAYGKVAIEAQFAVLRNLAPYDMTVLFESAVHPDMAEGDFQLLADEYGVRFMQIYCHAAPEVLLSRFDQRVRSGARHPGHPDTAGRRTLDDAKGWLDAYGQLPLQETVTIDTGTSDGINYDSLLKSIREFI